MPGNSKFLIRPNIRGHNVTGKRFVVLFFPLWLLLVLLSDISSATTFPTAVPVPEAEVLCPPCSCSRSCCKRNQRRPALLVPQMNRIFSSNFKRRNMYVSIMIRFSVVFATADKKKYLRYKFSVKFFDFPPIYPIPIPSIYFSG